MSILPKAAALVVVVSLAGCFAPGPVDGGKHSNVKQLDLGMGPTQVEAALGASQFAQTSQSDPSISCRSHIYGEVGDAKFAHVTYKNGVLVGATDGHDAPCVPA